MQFKLTTRHKLTVYTLMTVLLTLGVLVAIVLVPNVAAQGDGPRLSLVIEALNVRAGPGVSYPVIDWVTQDDEVVVIGHHAASGWWQVRLSDGRVGWVSGGAAYVSVSGDTASVPEVAAPDQSAEPGVVTGVGQTGIIVFQTVSGGSIYAVDTNGSNLRYLTTGMDPALSPDGRRVAFTRWDDTQHGASGSLWVINVDGTGERAILGEAHQPKSPVWSPDGSQIVFNMQQGGRLQSEFKCSHSLPSDPIEDKEDIDVNVDIGQDGSVDVEFCYTLLPHPFWGLRLVDVATGEFRDLPDDRFSYGPTWDPANNWHLVYAGEQGLVNLDLNQGTTWALTNDVRDQGPVFSPDGSRIAVTYKQHDNMDIHVMNADGSGRIRLTKTPLSVIVDQRISGVEPRAWNNVAPAWSPDGSQIAFLTDRTGQWEIWVMNTDGSNQRPLFAPGALSGLTLEYHNVDERVLTWR